MSHCKAANTLKMTQRALCFLIVFLVFLSAVEAWGKSSKQQVYSRGGRSYNDDQQQRGVDTESQQKSSSKPTSKSSSGGMGAWGYVAIILTLIGAGMGAYYFTLFYPILCKKERKYDVMEMGAVNV